MLNHMSLISRLNKMKPPTLPSFNLTHLRLDDAEFLGAGSYASVIKMHGQDGKMYAVKLVRCKHPYWFRERDIYKLLADKPHPTIQVGVVCPFYTTCVDIDTGKPWHDPHDPQNVEANDNKLFIAVLEYVPEKTLGMEKSRCSTRLWPTEWLGCDAPTKGPHLDLTYEQVEGVVAQLLMAQEAYQTQLHLIHRDIKLDNVAIVVRDDILCYGVTEQQLPPPTFVLAKLLDWGFGKVVEDDDGLTNTHEVGTPNTNCPVIDVGNEYNFTVDIYSIALVGLQLLFGYTPGFVTRPHIDDEGGMRECRREMTLHDYLAEYDKFYDQQPRQFPHRGKMLKQSFGEALCMMLQVNENPKDRSRAQVYESQWFLAQKNKWSKMMTFFGSRIARYPHVAQQQQQQQQPQPQLQPQQEEE